MCPPRTSDSMALFGNRVFAGGIKERFSRRGHPQSEWALNLVTGILFREKRDSFGTRQAEKADVQTGEVLPGAAAEAGRDFKNPPLEPSERAWPASTSILDSWPPAPRENNFLSSKSPSLW